MRSMTGFGRGQSADGGITIEISSVNRKQLELRFTLPREMSTLEAELRGLITGRISRGSVCVRMTLGTNSDNNAQNTRLDCELLARLVSEAREAAQLLGLKQELAISDFLNVPGVIVNAAPDLEASEFQHAMREALEHALEAYDAMRDTEGDALCADLARRVASLEQLLEELKPFTQDLELKNRERLLAKLKDANLPIDAGDERLLKEVVFYADKADTTEETTRLASHFSQFRNFLADRTQPVGRGLDFLLQEMFREITTFGNKAQGTGASPLVVSFKTELEKIREQVQNIE